MAPSRLGRYEIVREIGRGGMAVVYEAFDPSLARRVALKVTRGDAKEPAVRRFHNEAVIAARLRHPNIVAIHEVGLDDSGPGHPAHYIAMDFVEGPTLAGLIAQGAPRDELLRLVQEVARAAAFAHDRGVVHRDLKPANILVEPSGRPILTDFGLARASEPDFRLTRGHDILGTPLYMAPEQVRARPVDARTDVYALGVMLYEALTGRTPFAGRTSAEIYQAILSTEPAPPSRHAAVSPELDAVCLTALEKDPAHRYGSAAEFADDLTRARRGEPARARAGALRRFLARRRLPLAVAAAVLALLGAAALVSGVLHARRVHAALAAAEEAERAGDPLRARDAWRAVLELAPDRDEANRAFNAAEEEIRRLAEDGRERAAREEALRRIELARPLLERATEALYDPDSDPLAILKLADDARTGLEHALAAAPRFPLAYHLLARACELQGRSDEAEAAWRRALDLDSRFAAARFHLARLLLGRAYFETVDVRDAIKRRRPAAENLAAEAAAQIEHAGLDDDLQRAVARAMAAFTRTDMKECARVAREALERHGERRGAEDLLWLLAVSSGDGDLLDRALALRPKYADALFSRALARTGQDPAGAVADYDALLRVNPRRWQAYVNRAHLLLRLGNLPRALADFRAAVALNPDHASTHAGLATARVEAGDLHGALRDCDEAVRLEPAIGAYRMNRGTVLLRLGRLDDAIADYEEAARHDSSGRSHSALGTALSDRASRSAAKGARSDADVDRSRSLQAFADALRLDPSSMQALLNRAFLYRELGRLDEALVDCDAAVAAHPDQPDSWYHRGTLRLQRGETDAAVRDLERALEIAPLSWPSRDEAKRALLRVRRK